jgi:phage/plasmid-associated DNA primase
MGKKDRLEREERHLRLLETEFVKTLRENLETAAAGRWGVFGAHLNTPGLGPRANDDFHEINDLGGEINNLRKKLGITGEFEVYRLYKEYCKRHGSNDPGEPRLARMFLTELGAEGTVTDAPPPDKLPG